MRPKLLLVAPNDHIARTAQEVIEESGFNCQIVIGNLQNNGEKYALEAERDGTEAVISRGGTFLKIKEVLTSIPCVPINVSTLDILEALNSVAKTHKKVGVMGFSNTIYEASSVGKYLNLEIVEIPFEDLTTLNQRIEKETGNGLEVIVGDTVSAHIASELGVIGVLINSGKRALYHALENAEEMAYLRRKEAFAQHRIRAILGCVNEGIIAIDNNGLITEINPAVERYLGTETSKLIGKPASEMLPAFQFASDELVNIRDQKFLITSQPINYEGNERGFILTLKPLKQIQDMETRARKKLHNRGLVAKHVFSDIIGESEPILKAKEWAIRISKSNATVIINGKTGTGKEMFAQSIHNSSHYANGPFIGVNCASFPESLLESELFGYVEGSFTDARKGGKIGLFELAHKGTIFLDEIGDMSLAVQAKVLRVLQEKEVIRLGDDKVIPVDIRVIAATHVDLSEAVKQGRFREDLFYRINVLKVTIPPLSERHKDIILLAEQFVHKLAPSYWIESGAFHPLLNYLWPGNVRELFNFIEQLVVLSDDSIIRKEDVQSLLPQTVGQERSLTNIITYSRRLRDEDILAVLDECGGNQTLACERLGINRSTLWRRLQKLRKRQIEM